VSERRQQADVLTPTPVEWARALAEDRHLAVEFAQLSSVGDMPDAIQVATEAAADIVDRCLRGHTPEDRDRSFALVVETIGRVARERDALGDELQAVWCRTLSECLLDGGWAGAGIEPTSAP
jgi:uncharacterized protein with PhoU and TrkA domain